MSKEKATEMGRRDFFRKATLGAGVAGVAAAGLAKGAAAGEPVKQQASGSGYRETDHVKKYYELARF
ncbi:MAG: formate dehydrogenase [Limibacillus sp.]|jgi:hypothetical protein